MKKLVCLDMDGTINLGYKLIPGAKKFFDFVADNNIGFCFFTNNSSNVVSYYVRKMNKLGVSCNNNNFYTSTDATINYLKMNECHTIFALGTKSFIGELKKNFIVISEYDSNISLDSVVVGFDTELKYDNIVTACKYLEDGYPFIATNPDLRCPIDKDRFIPDCGAICHLLRDATNRVPIFLGKPKADFVNNICKKFGVKKNEVIIVGDRLYTDILSGVNSGVDTVAVLTGETSEKEIANSRYKPTYMIESIEYLTDVLKGKIERYVS